MNTDFSTTDLNLATALAALGYDLYNLDRTNPRKVRFLFRHSEGIKETVEAFWNNSLTLPAQQLLTTQRQIKNRIHSEDQL